MLMATPRLASGSVYAVAAYWTHLVGMMDLGLVPPAHRLPRGRLGEPLIEAAAQLPAPDTACEHVHKGRQIDELLPEPDGCDISDPDRIGMVHLQALDQAG
jgi:hypothetical protein